MNKDFVNLLFIATITSIVWAVYQIYHTYNKPKITDLQKELVLPFETEIDIKYLKSLKNKIVYFNLE